MRRDRHRQIGSLAAARARSRRAGPEPALPGIRGRPDRAARGPPRRPWARQLQRASELPGPFRRSFWRSPIRGPWLTSVFGLILLAGIPVLFVTGLLSYAAYNPDLSPLNDQTPGKGLLGFYLFSWPTHPVWLYRLNQGVHVILGLVLVPILLAKLWSVLPKLFELAAGPQCRRMPWNGCRCSCWSAGWCSSSPPGS